MPQYQASPDNCDGNTLVIGNLSLHEGGGVSVAGVNIDGLYWRNVHVDIADEFFPEVGFHGQSPQSPTATITLESNSDAMIQWIVTNDPAQQELFSTNAKPITGPFSLKSQRRINLHDE